MLPKYGLPVWDRKMPAAGRPIATPSFSGRRVLPLSLSENVQTTDFALHTQITRGTVVYTDANGFPTLAPTAGEIVGYTTIRHPLYGELICAEIDPAAQSQEAPQGLPQVSENATKQQILNIARLAGIVDELDGQPLWEKLQQAGEGVTLVVDATEAEPYATAAYATLLTQAASVHRGMHMATTAADAANCVIAFCPVNSQMRQKVCELYHAEELYFTKKQYPVTQYCVQDTAVLRIGVQATVALAEALLSGTAPTGCVVTVAGDGVETPQNVFVPFGTPVQAVLDACATARELAAVVAGDALTGLPVPDTTVPVLPGMTCLLALRSLPLTENHPCIGCGRCAAICHAGLLPYEIERRLENMHYERLPALHPEACDACGACNVVCPAQRDVMRAVLRAGETNGGVFLQLGGDDDV